jgi:conserved hypothetical protein, ribA/ribD-fused
MTITLFYRNSPFSNFYPSKFYLDGEYFLTVEHYFQFSKAKYFKDELRANKILIAVTAMEAKRLGHSVTQFDKSKWDEISFTIMKRGVTAKFSQNGFLKRFLQRSQGIIAEASSTDTKWGIGLAENDPEAFSQEKWKGENLLGKILMEIRDKV